MSSNNEAYNMKLLKTKGKINDRTTTKIMSTNRILTMDW